MVDPFRPLNGAASAGSLSARGASKSKAEWLPVLPVPDDAPAPPERHPKLGVPSGRWTYKDAEGRLLGFALRFDAEGGKEFRPLVLFEPASGGLPQWRWTAWLAPRPLYGLDRLAERPAAPVIVCEGEKAADAAARLLKSYVSITSPNGSKSAAKADWSSLKGRDVVIFPDADAAGQDYAAEVSKILAKIGAKSIRLVSPPEGCAVGWDAADAFDEGWTSARLNQLISSAKTIEEPEPSSDAVEKPGRQRRPAQRDQLMGLTTDCDLFHGIDGEEAYIRYPVNGHFENRAVRSQPFKRWLAARAFEHSGIVPGAQAIEDTLRVLEARATSDGPTREPWRRVGKRDGKLYLDLCDSGWRVVEVDISGWRVLDKHDAPFIRSRAMIELPTPEGGYAVDEMRRFVNVAGDDDFVLMISWLLAGFRPDGPYPVACIGGEQGSGKSNLSLLMRSLVDPNTAPIRAPPKDERDLIVAAANAHVLCYDNLSKVEQWLSDALCRLATGGGFSSRELHTDLDEKVFHGVRPILLNGIPALTDKPDLGDRAITIRLQPIAEEAREAEDELRADWQIARPRVLGALLDAVSSGMRNLPSVKLLKKPRLADFAKWMTACEPGLGWDPGTFVAAYENNRRNVSEGSFDADIVAVAIHRFIMRDNSEGWTGTATELLDKLNFDASDQIKRSIAWPKTAQGLGNRFDRIAPLLRGKGFVVERKHSGVRTITIAPKRD